MEGNMTTDSGKLERREFMKIAAAATAVGGAVSVSTTAQAQETGFRNINALAQLWRVKQLQYSLMRSVMGRHRDFWQLTGDGLSYATKSLKLDLTADKRKRLTDAYVSLAAFPDVK